MRAFTVHQPYAYAIVAGLKRYETRPGRTSIRGRVAVHAAKQKKLFISMPVSLIIPEETILHYGAVLGTVEIAGCVTVEDVMDGLTEQEKALGDYSQGRWAWVLKNPVMFDTPVPACGQQGWWNWEGAGRGEK